MQHPDEPDSIDGRGNRGRLDDLGGRETCHYAHTMKKVTSEREELSTHTLLTKDWSREKIETKRPESGVDNALQLLL